MLIKDGVNGFLIKRNVESIKNALSRLHDDRVLCAKMGQANRQIIEREGWAWESRALNYEVMFNTVLSR
jgi:glycosyltransferase involved in cell wall biosynthesis